MFVSDSALKSKLADRLQKLGAGALDDHWDSVVQDSNRSAYADVVATLSARGFTAAQIATWGGTAGADYQLEIALWRALQWGDFDSEKVEFFSKQEDRALARLEKVTVTEAEAPVSAGTKQSPVGFGRLSNPNDVFSLPEGSQVPGRRPWPRW